MPIWRKMFYSTNDPRQTERRERRHWHRTGTDAGDGVRDRRQVKAGEVTPLDLLDVLEKRVAEVDGKVNALPTLCFDRARAHAKTLMQKPVADRGLLAGLPVPIKDLTDVAGVLTTQGSPIYRDNIPARSDILVEHLEAQWRRDLRQIQHAGIRRRRQHLQRSVRRHAQPLGYVALGRRLLGRRRGRARHRYGLACPRLGHGRLVAQSRQLLRHRRACGRASAASRIRPQFKVDRKLGVQGPMARNVEDLALLLDAMSGEHPADPLSLPKLPASYLVRRAIRRQAEARRLFGRSRHHPGRSGSAEHHPEGRATLCRGRRDRRGGPSRPARGP